jgi:hypothetical protein
MLNFAACACKGRGCPTASGTRPLRESRWGWAPGSAGPYTQIGGAGHARVSSKERCVHWPWLHRGGAGHGKFDLVVVNIHETPCMSCKLWGIHEPGGFQTFSTHIRFHVHGWNNRPWILSFLLESCSKYGNFLVVPVDCGNTQDV